MNNAQKYGDHLPIIVVEGFKSVWRLYECGIKNAVAVIGSTLTEGQCSLLYLYALKGAVIMFDNDEAGIIGITRAYESLKGKLDVIPVYITETDEFGKGLGPDDLSDEQLCGYLDTYF
jgi:DNA primase